jgi:tetratricopeptide (TPR) repeat protein
MKIFIVLFLLLNTVFISQSPLESSELKEATDLTNAAVKLFNEQKSEAALKKVKRALEIRERLLPRTDSRVAESLGQAGNLYFTIGDYDNARKIFERLLVIQEERFGPEHIQAADTLYAMGQSYRLQRKYDLAQTAYRRSLMIYGRESGVKTPAFERASIGMRCLAYESKNFEASKELEAIQKQFAPPGEPPKLKGILNGSALSLPKPEYPMGVNGPRAAGTITVFVEINEEGKVTSARDVCYGPPDLTAASIKAALKARFTPTILQGKPISVTGFIQYNFVAPDRRFP